MPYNVVECPRSHELMAYGLWSHSDSPAHLVLQTSYSKCKSSSDTVRDAHNFFTPSVPLWDLWEALMGAWYYTGQSRVPTASALCSKAEGDEAPTQVMPIYIGHSMLLLST